MQPLGELQENESIDIFGFSPTILTSIGDDRIRTPVGVFQLEVQRSRCGEVDYVKGSSTYLVRNGQLRVSYFRYLYVPVAIHDSPSVGTVILIEVLDDGRE